MAWTFNLVAGPAGRKGTACLHMKRLLLQKPLTAMPFRVNRPGIFSIFDGLQELRDSMAQADGQVPPGIRRRSSAICSRRDRQLFATADLELLAARSSSGPSRAQRPARAPNAGFFCAA